MIAEGGAWLVDLSSQPPISADIVAYPGVKLLLRASQRPEASPLGLGLDGFDKRFPSMAAWMKRVERLKGYENTYPPHWRQA